MVLGFLVGVDCLKGDPGLFAVYPGDGAVQFLPEVLQRRKGERTVVHGLVAQLRLPTHEGLSLGSITGRIRSHVFLVGVGGDYVAAANGVPLSIHEIQVDDVVLISIHRLEGHRRLVLIPRQVQLRQVAVGKLALIHGACTDPSLPAYEGLTRGGCGICNLQFPIGVGGDHVAAAKRGDAVLIHKAHVDGLHGLFKDGHKGDRRFVLIEAYIVLLHQRVEVVVGKAVRVHGGGAQTDLPAFESLSLGSKALGIGDIHGLLRHSGDGVAAAQRHVLVIHILHKSSVDGVYPHSSNCR